MKSSSFKLIFVFSIVVMSCKKDYAMQTQSALTDNGKESSKNSSQPRKGYKYFEFTDQELGILSTRVQIPKSWNASKTDIYLFEGPNDMRIGKSQMQNMGNSYPMDINQIIDTYYMSNAPDGNKPVNIYELPKLAKKTEEFLWMNYTNLPTKYSVNSYAVEWKDNNNRRYVTVLHRMITTIQGQSYWGYMSQHAEAPSNYYDTAKKVFIDALLSEQHNTDWLFKKNRIAAQKINQSWKVHNARMAAIKLNSSNSSFTSSSSSSNIGNIYSDILDINHSGYLKRSNMTSHGQTRTINMVGERNVISNHNNGEHYNVQAGSKYYWVNTNGKYFGTDNANYDPRTDRKINQTEWSQFQIEN